MLARRQVPEATFQRMDMRDLAFSSAAFDAITAIYTVFHLPRVEHAVLFAGFARVLKPGGQVAADLGDQGIHRPGRI